MKTRFLHVLLAATLLPLAARAQQVVTATPPASSPAPAQAPAGTVVTAGTPAGANKSIYLDRLPTTDELSQAAAAQGLTLERVEQSDAYVVARYKNASGATNTVVYRVLPAAQTQTPPPAVFAEQPPRDGYRDRFDRYHSPFWHPRSGRRKGFGFNRRGHIHRRR